MKKRRIGRNTVRHTDETQRQKRKKERKKNPPEMRFSH